MPLRLARSRAVMVLLSAAVGVLGALAGVPLAAAGGPGPVAAADTRAPEEAAALVPFGATTATPPINAGCTQPGTTGNRIQAVYVYYGTARSRLATVRPRIVDALKRANGIVYYSSRQTGSSRSLRLTTDSACQPSVASVNLPASAASSFSGTVSALQAKGYTSTQRKYILFSEARAMCGLAQTYVDDSPSGQNRNNRGPQFARVDLGCWSGAVVAHEVFHTLGAVQRSAPNADGTLHCRDDRDAMCYPGAGGASVYVKASCAAAINDERLDCAKNDYFNTNPAPGSYLATRWNTARSAFLWGGGPAYAFPSGPVRGLVATTPTARSIRVAWSAPAVTSTQSAATYYRVMRGTSTLNMRLMTNTVGLGYTDPAPFAGRSIYRVIPVNAGGSGVGSRVSVLR